MKMSTCLLFTVLIMTVNMVYAQHALDYDGRQTFSLIPRNDVYNCENVTLEVWINPDQCVAQDRWDSIINKPYISHNPPHYQWLLSRHLLGNISISFTINNSSQGVRSDEDILELNEWSHIAATYDGENIRLYLNGELVAERELEGTITGYNTDISFGRLGNVAVDFYQGIIDEVRIWDFARSEEEIGRTMNSMISGEEDGLIGYWRFDEGEGQTFEDLSPTGIDGRLGASNNEEAADPDWVESDVPLYRGILELSAELIEFGPVPSGQTGEFELELENTAEEQDEMHVVTFNVDLPDDMEWLRVEPAEGNIDPGQSTIVTFSANAEELELGEYDGSVAIVANASNVQYVEIPFHIFVVEGFGRLHGLVYDAVDDCVVPGALVQIDQYDISTEADDRGFYDFPEIPAWTYDIVVTAEDYLPLWELEVVIENEADVELNFAMLYSDCNVDPDEIEIALEPDDQFEIPLEISNPGSGSLTWQVERIFPNAPEEDPWEIRQVINAEEIVEDDALNGVAFVDGHFFISGGNNGEDINKIYKFDVDGNHVGEFNQFHESHYGMRGLTCDGDLLWGADENILYGFNSVGEHVETIEGDARSYRALTWDPDNNIFWSAGVTSDIYATDLNGEVVREIEVPGEVRNYGLAYWHEDPDGYNLYVFSRGAETDIQVNKVNLDNGDWRVAAAFDLEDGRPGGIHITNLYDPYSWVIVGLVQGSDRVVVWHLGGRTDWMTVEPVEGVVDAGGDQDLTVTLSSAGMPEETVMEAELVFSHDGIDGETVVSVSLEVMAGGITMRQLSLEIGWNLVSLNVYPDIQDFEELLTPLVEDNLLIIAKDGAGNFYAPAQNFNNIERWVGLEGYMMKMARSTELFVTGVGILLNTPIELTEGWNMVSYLPRIPVDARTALSRLGNALIIAKDGFGGFYIPEWDFSNMGNMREGEGYFIKVNGDVELTYSIGDGEAATVPYYSEVDHAWISELKPTGSSFSLLIIGDDFEPGTRLEALTHAGILAGRGVVDADGRCGITLWGDDPTTDIIDGYVEDETIHISDTDGSELELVWNDSYPGGWSADEWGVAYGGKASLPVEFGIHAAYPNPFNSRMVVEFALVSSGQAVLKAYDLSGREIACLISGRFGAGIHRVPWQADDLPSGVYLLRLAADDRTQVRKVVLVR